VYIAATRYKLCDYQPYLFLTIDSGKTWQRISDSFPGNEITRVVRADPVRKGLLFVGTETGIFVTFDDGQRWMRMPGGLPVVPVYDLKIKGADIIAGTHGRSFWILDDISPLRALADSDGRTRLVAPRNTVRTKLHFGALGGVRIPYSFALTFGIGGGIATTERPDGIRVREHLDVGENPPSGAIIYYWLEEGISGPVTLTFRDAKGAEIIVLRSDDTVLPPARRPTVQPGLNRFVWDMKHPGPPRIDPPWADKKNKPLANEPDAQAGPTVVPGDYRVELAVGATHEAADFSIVKDPRVPTSAEDYEKQFVLLKQLNDKLSALNSVVSRIRRARRNLRALSENVSDRRELAGKVTSTEQALALIESVLVDVNRESPRDTLRFPAGLNDTLVDLINTAAIADMVPTTQTVEVSNEIMGRVDAEIAKLDALLSGDVAEINRIAADASIRYVTTD
jgi:hypothetical protein